MEHDDHDDDDGKTSETLVYETPEIKSTFDTLRILLALLSLPSRFDCMPAAIALLSPSGGFCSLLLPDP